MAGDRGAGAARPVPLGEPGEWAAWPEALGAVVEQLPVGVALYDARDDDFRVVFVNQVGRQLAGGPDAVAGRPFREAYPEADWPAMQALLRRVRDDGEQIWQRGLVAPSGRTWNVQFLPIAATTEGRARFVMGAGYEVTEEIRGQHHLEALLRSSEPLQGLTDADSLARLAAEQGAALIPGIDCAVVVRDHDDRAALRLAGATGEVFAPLLGTLMDLPGTLSERALQAGAPVETGAADAESPVAPRIEGAPQTARLVPLAATAPGGQTLSLGVIGYYRASPGGFLDSERRLLDEYASRVAVALHRVRLLEEATARARRLRTGMDLALDLGSSLDPEQVVERLLQRLLEAVHADEVVMLRVEPDAVVVEGSLDRSGPSWPKGRRIPITVPQFRHMLETREPLLGSYEVEHVPAEYRGSLSVTGVMATVPVVLHNQVYAALVAARRDGGPFVPDDVALLTELAPVAGLALHNARLFEARRDFMNMAAHELRTPLTVLNGYLSMLRDGTFGPPSDRWQGPLQVMAGKVEDLARLVDDLLIGARLERGATRNDPRLLDVPLSVTAAVERAQARAALLGGRITLEAPRDVPQVVADRDAVARILDNLINNALTYCAEAPQVAVRVDADEGMVQVAVEDRGRGIPAHLHERVFEQFFRIEDRNLGYPLGTGLGLYISRQLAQAQGGGLRIQRSAPDEGSVFVLEMPVAARA